MATARDERQRATEARLSLPSLGPRDAVLSANTRGYRGYSRKLQDMLKQQQQLDGERGRKEQTRRERSKKFEPHNWKSLSAKQLTGMSAFERSRYMAYEPVPKDIQEKQAMALMRVRAARTAERKHDRLTLGELIETEQNDELIGQLNAAEALQRTRKTKTDWERAASEELEHLITSQPTAMKAVRLETLMSMSTHPVSLQLLTKTECNRAQALLEDSSGYTVARIV
ncbi:hypothetical protein EMCRGX_G014372 [Ephydatia muelleri]|eukprot:Em0005g1541a